MVELAPIPMKYRIPEIEFPKGWYAVAESKEVMPGTLLPVGYFDQQMIVYRTEDGKAQVADAYCPHLGAHLASHDGCIEGGEIVCPFHKWRFNGITGKVAAIPYTKTLPPDSVGLTLYPTREVDGIVVVWHHPQGTQPDSEPFSCAELQVGNWVLYDTVTWITTCPFRDILENLFDTAHVQQLHHSHDMPAMRTLERRPYGLFVDYAMNPDVEEFPVTRMELNFSGVSLLSQLTEGRGFASLYVTSFTPVDAEKFKQVTRIYMKVDRPELLDLIGKPWIERFVYEVQQDLNVLNYKKHLPQPKLCAGDGPIMRWRDYAAGYYSQA